MGIVYDVSSFMVGSSLCLLGSVIVFEGALSLLGLAVFAPMALGGLGLGVSSLKKIFAYIETGGFYENDSTLCQDINR